MNRRLQLIMIIFVVVLIMAIISHAVTAWLGIETAPGGYWVLGPGNGKASTFMAGSSLSGDAIVWPEIADDFNLRIEGWGVRGSSPSEWEHYQQGTHATLTILVVSPYDLNEYFLSDHYAQVVPFTQALDDLRKTPMNWDFFKRVVSTYPLAYARVPFPTAGRSDGVIRGIREKIQTLISSMFGREPEKSATPSFTDPVSQVEIKKVRITNWSPSLMLRRLVSMRMACEGKHGYNGPKHMAFLRMLHKGQEHGRVMVVVLPVSPAYVQEFVTSEVKREFEAALTEAKQSVPNAYWIRLDQVNELIANENFYDLVHMNPEGQRMATDSLLTRFKEFARPL